jgi:thiol:disulfide interchange protein
MKKLITILLAALTLPLLAGDFPAGSPKFEHSLAAVTKAAKTSGKPVIVVFSAVWCPPCQMMKKEVYPSAAVKALHDKFEWAYLDVDEDSNAAAAKKYGVNGIPHIQFLSKDGKDLGNQVGSTSAEDFAHSLEGVLKKAAK